MDTRASQASVDAWRTDEARLAIERQLAQGTALVSFILPAALGGRIESVRAIVAEALDRSAAAGADVGQARVLLARGPHEAGGRETRRRVDRVREGLPVADALVRALAGA